MKKITILFLTFLFLSGGMIHLNGKNGQSVKVDFNNNAEFPFARKPKGGSFTANNDNLTSGSHPKLLPADSSIGPKIDLRKEATLTASHHTTEWVIENAIDGNPETQWIGEDQPLSWQPTNIIIDFKKPKTIQRIVLYSVKHRNMLAIKDFEIFAWGNKTWAGESPLAVVKDTKQEVNTIDFAPVKTKSIRIRIHDTYYYHIFPRLAEIEVYEASTGAKGKKLSDAPIPGDKRSEQMILDRAYGRVLHFPRTKFDPSRGYLYYATTFADTMIASGTDHYGQVKSPMFTSLIDLETHQNPIDAPGNSPGQRYGDRSLRGGNLFQDVMLLKAMDYMTELTGNQKYQKAVTDYLTFFLENCPAPQTGLFPWGEHAYWNFYEEKNTYSTHEFLGGVPISFWERIWKINPDALLGEADGLINHIENLNDYHFDRHADITKPLPIPRPSEYGGMDFPRHAGFYIGLWTFAYSKTKDEKYLDWSQKMIDHHWNLRNPESGLPPEKTGAENASAVTTLALSLNLLEASELLPEGSVRSRYEKVAEAYLTSILRLPHKPVEGKFLINFPMEMAPEDASGTYGEPYTYGYGGGLSADYAVLLVAIYRLNHDEQTLNLAEEFSDFYANHDPPPITEAVFARVYASIIGLFNDLYEIEHQDQYLDQAKRYAKYAIENLYHNGLFRGATNINHYEGDMMVGNLVYNLVWLHTIENKVDIKIEPNYFAR